MTPSDRMAAQAALNEGRAVYGRLDQIRGPEDAAADIMELWTAGESAMRAMLGGSSLSGQPLVRELRQRGVLNLEQANTIASFWDARNRVDDVAYKPTLTDVGFARAGYNELGRIASETPTAAAGAGSSSASSFAPGGAATAAAAGAAATAAGAQAAAGRPATMPGASSTPPVTGTAASTRSARRLRMPLLVTIVVVALVAIAVALYIARGRSRFDSEMATAISLMTTGRTEAARGSFTAIAHEYPDRAAPHVFLSRMAREDNPPDMNTARQELVTAIRLEPTYEPAQREMGIFQLAAQNPSLARNFLVRAVQLAPGDSAAQGYLGCALMRLNRVDEAQRFLTRAGTGTWSSCAAPSTPAAPVNP